MARRGWLLAVALAGCGVEEAATGQAYEPIATSTGDAVGTTGRSSSTGPVAPQPATSSSEGSSEGAQTSDGDGSSSEGTTGSADDCPRVRVSVADGLTLNVRPDPSTANPPVGALADGAIVDVVAETVGESVEGNDVWFEIDGGGVQGFVSAVFATCTVDEAPDLDPDGWYLPLACGTSAVVTQGNNGALSHNGTAAYAFDFGLPLGSPLVAIADGEVARIFDETGPGDPCYDGGGMECSGFANYVVLLHDDGSQSLYMHLQSVSVGLGDTVTVGTEVGLSGSTGWSTGRHAHVMRMENCASYYCQSIPLAFSDVPGDGVPVTGDTVVSGNCP